MLKGIRGVRLDNRKILRAPDPVSKYFERLFFRLIKWSLFNALEFKDEYILVHYSAFYYRNKV